MGLLRYMPNINFNKRIQASTLVETLVGTVIIVVIFAIAMMTLNNLFKNVMKNNTLKIDNHLFKLQYLHQNNKLNLPYQEEFENWEIEIKRKKTKKEQIELRATHRLTNKTRDYDY